MDIAFSRKIAPLFATLTIAALAQQLAPPQREIALYQGVAPGSEDWNWSETQTTTGMPMVQNVVRPVLQYYPADKNTAVGTEMIVAPGGGFRNLMMSYEGVDVARRLNAVGIDAFVLKYRLTYTAPKAPEWRRRQCPGRSTARPERARTGRCRWTTGRANHSPACGGVWCAPRPYRYDRLLGGRCRATVRCHRSARLPAQLRSADLCRRG